MDLLCTIFDALGIKIFDAMWPKSNVTLLRNCDAWCIRNFFDINYSSKTIFFQNNLSKSFLYSENSFPLGAYGMLKMQSYVLNYRNMSRLFLLIEIQFFLKGSSNCEFLSIFNKILVKNRLSYVYCNQVKLSATSFHIYFYIKLQSVKRII